MIKSFLAAIVAAYMAFVGAFHSVEEQQPLATASSTTTVSAPTSTPSSTSDTRPSTPKISNTPDLSYEAYKASQSQEKKIIEQVPKAEPKPITIEKTTSISTAEIGNYIGGVTQVNCKNGKGTGFLLHISSGYVTVTNDHVVVGSDTCAVMPESSNGKTLGHYQLNLASILEWNPYTDIAILKMTVSTAAQSWSKPVSSLNYNLSDLRSCPAKMSSGSPVIVIGYPAFGMQQVQVEGYTGVISARQVTEGIISGYDTSVQTPIGNLPYANYYVSAKIDSGNSGGIALSKDINGLCLLGVATWLAFGNYETQAVVQNIQNVMFVK